jgi:lactoylglutathione lyase
MRAVLVPELIVTDLERSLDFYRGLLGFKILYARPKERFAYLDRNGAELMLEQPHAHDRLWPRVELVQPFGRGVNFEIHVDDVEALHKTVRGAGIASFLPLEDRWYGRDAHELGVRQFAIQDPDGYLIRLSQAIGTRPAA